MPDASSEQNARLSGLGELHPVAAVDALLLTLARRQVGSVAVDPVLGAHRVSAERAGATVDLGVLPTATGDALAARLALLARLDLARPDEQQGHLRVQEGSHPPLDVLVVLRPTQTGLRVEARALVADPSAQTRSLWPYELGPEIGRGGMGVVLRGRHAVLDKPVAIKVLHEGLLTSAQRATRLLMEARAACRARHPAIVDTLDVGRLPDGRAFLVMELVEGPTLEAVLQQGPLSVRDAVALAHQCAQALAAAHAAGIVHRDVKPANIFVLPDRRAKLGDFGVAGAVSASEAPRGASLAYAAPEQAAGGAPDPRNDVFSLGVVLFEMLTGRQPAPGDSESPIVGPDGAVDPVLQALVARALARDPRDRTASAAELADGLAALEARVDEGGWRRWLPR